MFKRACSVLLLVLTIVAGSLALASPSSARSDRDCPDFATQHDAQIYFINKGGPASDPDRLDADHDGIACDSLPCPCYYSSHLPPPPAIRSSVRLGRSSTARIAGEPLQLSAQVYPYRARSVVIQRLSGGSWVRAKAGRTSSHGRFTWATSTRASDTTYRAYVPSTTIGGRRFTSATSAAGAVTTQAQTVDLTLPDDVVVGDRASAVVVASPVRSGRAVVLQRRSSGSWVTVHRTTESVTGRARFALPTTSARTTTYRTVVAKRNGAATMISRPVALVVSPPPDTTAPSAPTSVTASAGDASASLTWTAVTASDLAGYRVYRSSGGAWVQLTTVPLSGTSFTVTGLVNGSTVSLAVTAVDTAGNESPQATTTVTPVAPDPAPATPTGLTATPGDSVVDLQWTAGTEPDLAGYRVFRSDTEHGGYTLLGQVTSPSYQVTGLTNGTESWYAVEAVDTADQASALSAGVPATPVGAPVGP